MMRVSRSAETLVQLGKLANVALEQFTQMGDLSDQLLVGTGFCARRSVVCRNSQQYVQGLLRWWTPLSKYSTDWVIVHFGAVVEGAAC